MLSDIFYVSLEDACCFGYFDLKVNLRTYINFMYGYLRKTIIKT